VGPPVEVRTELKFSVWDAQQHFNRGATRTWADCFLSNRFLWRVRSDAKPSAAQPLERNKRLDLIKLLLIQIRRYRAIHPCNNQLLEVVSMFRFDSLRAGVVASGRRPLVGGFSRASNPIREEGPIPTSGTLSVPESAMVNEDDSLGFRGSLTPDDSRAALSLGS
jgi:hypothetical protein